VVLVVAVLDVEENPLEIKKAVLANEEALKGLLVEEEAKGETKGESRLEVVAIDLTETLEVTENQADSEENVGKDKILSI